AARGVKVIATPVVVNLTDDNHDGKVGVGDIPDILFPTMPAGQGQGGAIKAVSGDDGRELFTTAVPQQVADLNEIAAGDIDGDGLPEIVAAHTDGRHLVAFESDGTQKWVSDDAPLPGRSDSGGAIALADLDGDGKPEIVIGASVYSATGRLIGDGRSIGGTAATNTYTNISAVADVDLDGKPELIAGPSAYRLVNGQLSLVWRAAGFPDGFVGIGNFDSDPQAEIVVVGGGKVSMLNHDGTRVSGWNPSGSNGPVGLPNAAVGGAPTIFDADGDGTPEIGVADGSRYTVLRKDGSVLWSRVTQDFSSANTGSTSFDFEGDGKAEVVYRDEQYLWVYRGTDGQVLLQQPLRSGTATELPVVADVDGDGNAEIVVCSDNLFGGGIESTGVYVFGSASDSWANTRQIWNQHSYHVTNVNDDGTIPRVEANSWQASNTYRLNTLPAGPGGPLASPNLTASYIRTAKSGTSTVLTARVGNGGAILAPAKVKVAFYRGNPKAGGTLLGVGQTNDRLNPGYYEDVSVTLAADPGNDLWVVVDDDGTGKEAVRECDEGDNTHHFVRPGTGEIRGSKLRGGSNFGWTDWTSATVGKPGSATGVLPDGTTVRYDGEVFSALTQGTWNVWQPTSTWTSGSIIAPPTADRIDTAGGSNQKNVLTFSAPLVDPVMAIVSLGGHTSPSRYEFDQPFEILAGGPSVDWGGSALQLVAPNAIGGIELNGLVRFKGTFTQISWTDPLFSASTSFTIGAASEATPAAVHDQLFTRNLIVNGDAESGAGVASYGGVARPLPGWTTVNNFTAVQYAAAVPQVYTSANDPGPTNRGANFFSGGPSDATSSASQVIDISVGAALVDAGSVTYDLSGYLGGWQSERDAATVTARFKRADGVVLATATLGPVTPADRSNLTGLLARNATGTVPSGARSVEVNVTTTRVDGTSCDGYVDNLSLRLRETPLSGWTIFLDQNNNEKLDAGERWTVTDANGDYKFTDLPPATYTVREVQQPGWVQVSPGSTSATDLLTNGTFESGIAVPTGSGFLHIAPGSSDLPGWQASLDGVDVVGPTFFVPSEGVRSTDLNHLAQGRLSQDVPTTVGQRYQLSFAYAGNPVSVGGVGGPALKTARVQAGDAIATLSFDVSGQSTSTVGWTRRSVEFVATSPTTTIAFEGTSTGAGGIAIDDVSVRAVNADGKHLVSLAPSEVVTGRDFVNALADPSNRAPAFTSTPPTRATTGTAYRYDADATDADNDAVVYELLSGPSGMTIVAATGLLDWTPSADQTGTFPVRVRASDGRGGLTDQSFTVRLGTATADNAPPKITTVAPTTATRGTVYRYDVNATDPDGDPVTFALTAGPQGATINPATGLVTLDTTSLATGTYDLSVRAVDPFGAADVQTFQLQVAADAVGPVVGLSVVRGTQALTSPEVVVNLNDDLTIQLSATDNVGVTGRALTVGTQSLVLDGLGRASFKATAGGLFTITGTATDAAGNVGTATRTLRVLNPANANVPTVQITSPTEGASVGAVTQVRGSVTDVDGDLEYYEVSYAPLEEANQDDLRVGNYTRLSRGTGEVRDGVLATFDPTLLRNGQYILRVAAYDTNGLGRVEGLLVSVDTQLKLGNFRLEYTDLQIPLAGIPIAIDRVYDTLDARRKGDFGYGWSMKVRDGDLRETVPDTGSDIFSATPMKVGARVFVTTPAGKRVGFTFQPLPYQGGFFGTTYRPYFKPDPGVYEKLDVVGQDGAFSVNASGETTLPLFGFAWNPDVYQLTTQDNLKYTIDQRAGLQKIVDLSGNTVTFTPTGISHSSGQSIQIVRDAEGRVDKIIDPAGNPIDYTYNAAGDLTEYKDQEANATKFKYLVSPAHYLDEITDPLGRRATKTEYGPDGRIKAVIDALGNRVEQDFDPSNFTGTTTDANGNVTDLVYNARGNVLRKTDPAPQPGEARPVTLYEYGDAKNPDKETKVTDPLGRVKTMTYDVRGNTLTQTDPGGTTTYEYSARNTVTKSTDALGRTTEFAYDSADHLVSLRNPLGDRATFTHDALGRVTTSTDFNGNTTTYEYVGAQTQPSRALNPDGSSKTFQYNHYGQVTRLTNERGHSTLYRYDSTGKLLEEEDALGNVTRRTYDVAGNLKAVVVPALAIATTYEYDASNRLVRTTNAEGGVDKYTYDGNGNRLTLTDPIGNSTRWKYDALGRMVEEIDPAGRSRFVSYDAAGNQTKIVDRLGRIRKFMYDAL
ncbi:MAG TPA: FG-GAP-like repeat-containing protein, partial [Humisphaera sp.]